MYISSLNASRRVTSSHKHPEGQLFYCESGTIFVECSGNNWIVPATRALWIPPNIKHSASTFKPTKIRTAYTNPGLELPDDLKFCKVIFVNPLLRELMREVGNFSLNFSLDQLQHDLIDVIIGLLAKSSPEPNFIPFPSDPRLAKAIRAIFENAAQVTLEALTQSCGASSSTLKRLFQTEIGASFSKVRQQIRIIESLEHLNKGMNLSEIAFNYGYESPSAYSRAFKKIMGISPNQFRNTLR